MSLRHDGWTCPDKHRTHYCALSTMQTNPEVMGCDTWKVLADTS